MTDPIRIPEPGVYDIPSDTYHADPCAAPSLTASIAKILDDRSPLHAWTAHPRLNRDAKPVRRSEFDLGSAAHAVILKSGDELVIIDPADYPAKNGNIPAGWTNDAIRSARDAAYDAGKIPILPSQHDTIMDMVTAVMLATGANEELDGWDLAGRAEQTLVWREGDVWCRSRLDWMPDTPSGIYLDLKTTETSVNPETVGRYAMSMQWDVQEAFYRRGLMALGICTKPRFRFVAVESTRPHAVAIVGLPPEVAAMADAKVEHAIRTWRECMQSGHWQGYTNRTVWIDPPPWANMRHQERWAAQSGGSVSPESLRAGDAFQSPLRGANQ